VVAFMFSLYQMELFLCACRINFLLKSALKLLLINVDKKDMGILEQINMDADISL